MASTIKTTAVTMKDGREGRGVKVTEKNSEAVAEWLGEKRISRIWGTKKDGSIKNLRIKLRTPKGIRAAYVGDIIVKFQANRKLEPLFIVIKAEDFESLVKI